MAFYTNKWIILEKDDNNISLFRKLDTDITMEKIIGEIKENNKDYLCNDVFKEFDIEVDQEGNIYLLYQNSEMNLILKIFKEDKIETIKLTEKSIGEIIHLNIAIVSGKINILYIITTVDKNNYKIYHHYYHGKKWSTFMVEEINEEKVLNPIKILKEEGNLTLVYIKGKDILMTKFQFKNSKWDEKTLITNTENEKVFLDIIKVKDIYHMTYCEFTDNSLIVKYKKFNFEDEFYIRQESILSKKGSPSYPTIISYMGQIWVTWIELNKVNSRALNKNGKDWGPLYLWEESINKDIIRYKYVKKDKSDDMVLDYSFGKAYPEVQFLGFGPTDKAKEVPIDNEKSILKDTFNKKLRMF